MTKARLISLLMLAVFHREIVEQLADTRVGGALGGAVVELPRLCFHRACLPAHDLYAERPE